MTRHGDLLTFIGEMADRFSSYRVVGFNEKDGGPTVPITEIFADDSDGEICFVSGADDLTLADFYANLQRQVERYPDYSLMVSEWFEIDTEHRGRADSPLKGIEVDEEKQTFQLIY